MRIFKLSLFIVILQGIICFNAYYCQEIDIIYTNNTYGFLQPCSCPGAPFGGLNRRGTILKEIRQDTNSSILLDAGDLFSNINEVEKNKTILDIYKKMNYDAMNIGENELSSGFEFLKTTPLPFISSNIVSSQDKVNIFNGTLIIEKNDIKIGILGIMSNDSKNISDLNIEVLEPINVLKEYISELKGKVDFIIVLSRLAFDENVKIAKNTEGIDLIIGGYDFRPKEEATKIRKTLLVESGVKGHYVGKISLSKKPDFTPVNRLYTMKKSVKNDPEIQKMIDEFENNLANRQLKKLQNNNKFMGSIYCKGCHEKEYEQWETTKHATALEVLKKIGKGRVIGCLACHTTGYNLERETGVQCEQCHKMLTDHDKINREPIGVSRRVCKSCHTVEQDPGFNYIECLKEVIH